MIEPGTWIGRYHVQEQIGSGTSASVHRAWHSGLDRMVAIKFLPLLNDPASRARFVREARALRRLDHPNIVQVLDTGEVEGTSYMVFDYIAGGSLADRMTNGVELPAAQLVDILNGIARGLDYAHRKAIIHRDVKPANILMNDNGTAVIADFGLARLLEQPSLTAAGILFGTPAYMAPEQAEGKGIGPASDQYSLAAMAYELLTGAVPFPGETVSEVLTGLLTRDPVRPSSIRPSLSPEMDGALLRGLAKDPAKRFPTCQALVDAILTAMVASLPQLVATGSINVAAKPLAMPDRPVAATIMGVNANLAAIKAQPHETYLTIVVPYAEVGPRKLRRRRRWFVAAAAAAVLFSSGAAGLAWSQNAVGAIANNGSHVAGSVASPSR